MYYKVKEETIQDISDAIRTKSGASGEIQVQDFAQAILNLETNENIVAAEQSAIAAAGSAISAESSALAAAESAGAAATSYIKAVEDTTTIYENTAQSANEAATSAEKSAISAEESEISASKSDASALDSEAWAVGQRNGVDVLSDDATYQNSAKYWAGQAYNIVNLEEFTDTEIQTLWDTVFNQEVSE